MRSKKSNHDILKYVIFVLNQSFMFRTKIFIYLFSLIVFILTSCDRNRLFEENKEIPNSVWNRHNIISLKVPVTDTLSINRIFLNIRHSGLYEKSNMYLFINIIDPAGNKLRDTVNCILADDKGKWYGSGLGDIFSCQILYKKNISFPHIGNYTFELEQAMRVDNLKNVEDIGIRIEKEK